jgi:hypothetical protein
MASGVASLVSALLAAFSISERVSKAFSVALVVLTLLMFVPCLLALLLRPKAVRGERHLTEVKARDVIRIAVRPRLYPVCTNLSVSHASGATLMAFAVRDCHDALGRVLNLLDAVSGELRHECKFTLQSVVTHLQKVAKLRYRSSGLASTLSAGQCFDLPEARSVKPLLVLIDRRVRIALNDLVSLLRGAPKGTLWDREHPAYAGIIEECLKRSIPDSLEGLRRGNVSFARAGDSLRAVIEAMEEDWHEDVREVWKDDLCRPESV